MHKFSKNGHITSILAISLIALGGCTAQQGLHPYNKTNHLRANTPYQINHKANVQHRSSRYNNGASQQLRGNSPYPKVKPQKVSFMGKLRGQKPLNKQNYAPRPGPFDMFQRWVDYEPSYTLYPGDQIDIVVQSAPEMSRTLTVGPDGRITMPMVTPIMAAGRTIPQVQMMLTQALSKELRDPTIAVSSRSFAPQQIYVGGQVGQQGQYSLTGPIGSLEAIMMAGGFLPTAKSKSVAILRRAPNGGLMMRTINHKDGFKNIRSYADNMQLRRGDIVFVPRNSLSEVGVFMQQVRQAMPVDFSISYNLGNNTTTNNN